MGFLGNEESAYIAESSGIFATLGEILRGSALSQGRFYQFPISLLAERPLLRNEIPCVFGSNRYLSSATPRWRVSIFTNIGGANRGFLGNAESAESAESAGIISIFGKILRGARRFHRANFTSFYHVSAKEEGDSPEGISLCFRLQTVLIPGDPLEGVCPSIPTSTGLPEGFLGNAESAESAGIFAILGEILRAVSALS